MQSVRFVVLMWFIFVLIPAAFAQETVENAQLVTPSGTDYLTLLNDYYLSADEPDVELLRLILSDIQNFDRVDDTVSADDIYTTYLRLIDVPSQGTDFGYWLSHYLTAWINESDIDVSAHETLTTHEFNIELQPIDFWNDGEPESMLFVTSPLEKASVTADYDFEGYFVAYQDGDQYRVVDTPLKYNGLNRNHWSWIDWQEIRNGSNTSVEQVLHIEDINADGQLEWRILGYGDHNSPGGRLYAVFQILAWNGHRLVKIAPDSLGFGNDSYMAMDWNIINLDDDPALEIVQIYHHRNNWKCEYDEETIYDWSDKEQFYIEQDPIEIIPESFGCLWTDAEQAMWEHDYETAIPLYEQGIALAQDKMTGNQDIELLQYIQIRYISALALIGSYEDASQHLADLLRQENLDDNIQMLANQMQEAYEPYHNLVSLCSVFYNFFKPYQDKYSYSGHLSTVVGSTYYDADLSYIGNISSPSASFAGCDVQVLLDDILANTTFPLDQSPVEVLEDNGIAVADNLHFDWNGDGADEWIVATEADVSNYLFISDIELGEYIVSQPFYYGIKPDQTYLYELPDNRGRALLYYTFDVDSSYRGSCSPTYDTNSGEISILGLNSRGEKVNIWWGDICEAREWDQIISEDGTRINSWISDQDIGGQLHEAVYIWNTESFTYQLETPIPTPDVEVYASNPAEQETHSVTSNLYYALINHSDIAAKLNALDETFAKFDVSDIPDDTQIRAGYYRGLALLYLDRPDEALAQFIEVGENSPDSIWGQLAGLFYRP